MFAGSRLNRQRTVTDLYGVRAIFLSFPPIISNPARRVAFWSNRGPLVENSPGAVLWGPCALKAGGSLLL